MKLPLLIFFSTQLISCSLILPDRSFIDEMDRDSDGLWVPGEDFPVAAGDSGQLYRDHDEISKRTPATAYERRRMQEESHLRQELKTLERRLTEDQYKKYIIDRQDLPTVSDKIYYLRMNAGQREDYMASRRGFTGNVGSSRSYGRYPASIRSGYKKQYDEYNPVNIWKVGKDISQGMDKVTVRQIMGSPSRIDVAGNPNYENERWTYLKNGKPHYIYFEGGRVQGWVMN
ncbi:MAG: hypothetical protein ACPGJV_01015 [Bacteriovoracaceae bacterium]